MKYFPKELNIKILSNVVRENRNITNLLTVSKSWFNLFQEDENLNKTYEIRKRATRLLTLSQWHLPEEQLNTESWYKNPELSYADEDYEQDIDPETLHLQNELRFIFDGHYDAEIIRFLKTAYPEFFSVEKIMAPLNQCAWEYCFVYDLIQIDASLAIDALIKEGLFYPECTDCNDFTLLDYEVFYLPHPENSKPKSFDILVKHGKKYEFDKCFTIREYHHNPSLKDHPSVQACVKSLIRHQVKTNHELVILVNNDQELLQKLSDEVANESRNNSHHSCQP